MSTPAPNSPEALRGRVEAGRITWGAVIIVTCARTVLSFAAQGGTALVLWSQGAAAPYLEAGKWFTVHGTLVDVGSLALLWVLLRREGLTLRDLFRSRSSSLGRSLLFVPPILLALGVAGFTGAAITGFLIAGNPLVPAPVSPLPLWAALYSTLVWPLIWGVTEQMTYDGYAAPRARALSSSAWPVGIVCLGWAAQHFALPFRPDAEFLAYRFFPSLLVAVTAVAIYLRTRNLLPLAIAHWLIDLGTGALTLIDPPA